MNKEEERRMDRLVAVGITIFVVGWIVGFVMGYTI